MRLFKTLFNLLGFCKLVTAVSTDRSRLLKTPVSWTPPNYPPTTIDNDGTNDQRYDVRKTLAYVTSDERNVNNVFMLYWITTEDGKKYHITTNAGLYGGNKVGSFFSFNDFQTLSARGGSILEPGSGSSEHLNLTSVTQSIISPMSGDQWTNTNLSFDLAGFNLNVTIQPTGGNFYYGGNGGIQLTNRSAEMDYSTSIPGWSWYWANPTTRLSGTIAIDGIVSQIDSSKSFSLFERQWGNFGVGNGYYALWFYLETGEVLIAWCMEPNLEGISKVAFASIWHPNGWHEMVPVGSKSRASDVSTSSITRRKYFNKFFLDLPARGASFTFEKWFRDAELIPHLEEQRDSFSIISESYGEGTAWWNGRRIKIQGHVEQLSRLT